MEIEVEPPWHKPIFVRKPIEECQDDLWFTRQPGQRNDEIWVNMGAGGLGDSLLGLCAVKALKQKHLDRTVIYRVHRNQVPFVRLFDGYDGLAGHDYDETKYDIPPNADARDWQLNSGYRQELIQKAQITRLERYCRNLGVLEPVLPVLREPERLKTLGAQFRNAIILCPYAAWADREYPLHAWLTLEQTIRELGARVVVMASSRKDRPLRTDLFKSPIMLDEGAENIASSMLNAACVIGNDSGLAHLSGILGVPTIVLCGWSIGNQIFGTYPKAECIQGVLGCNGCWTTDPAYDKIVCGEGFCANLASITPERIMRAVVTRIGAKRES